jgi:excisionase family DNA binding protein
MPKNKSQVRLDAVNGGRRYASVPKAAAYIGVTDRTIRQMVADGRLTAYRGLGSRVLRIDLAEIDRVMESS